MNFTKAATYILIIGAAALHVSLCHGEDIALHFDNRQWEVANKQRNETQGVLECVLKGESVQNWSELVTAQVYFGLQDKVTPEEYMNAMVGRMKKMCPALIWNLIRQGKTDIMFEWDTTKCSGMDSQHEITRIITGKEGIHLAHYVTRKLPIAPEKRNEWITLLDAATLLTSNNQDAALSPENKEANKKSNDGLQRIQKGDWDGGLTLMKEALAVSPKAPHLHMNYASMLFMKGQRISESGDNEGAKEIFKEVDSELMNAINLFDKVKDAKLIGHCYFLLGDVYYYFSKDTENAKRFYEQAVAVFPEHGGAVKALQRFK